MASGVGVNDAAITTFNELKLNHKHVFITFKMNDNNTEIIVDQVGTSKDWSEFIATLPKTDCRYAVYDFEFDTEGGKRNKILFINWAPDVAKIKSKMLYAASKDAFKKKLVGLAIEIQATDLSEIGYEVVLDKCLNLAR